MNLILSFENMQFTPGILLLQNEKLIKNIENIFSDSKEASLVTLYITLYKKWKGYHFGLIKESESESYEISLLCDFHSLGGLFSYVSQSLKYSDIGYYVMGIKDSINISYPHIKEIKLESGPIPQSIEDHRGPMGESNSCFCDSYFVAMFMSTTKNDLPLEEGLYIRDWYDSKPTLFDNGPSIIGFEDKIGAVRDGVRLIDNIKSIIAQMRENPDASDGDFSIHIKDIREILTKFGFGRRVEDSYTGDDDNDKVYFVNGGKLYYVSTSQQEDVVEFNSFITEIIPAFKYWTIPYRVVQTVEYVVVSGKDWVGRYTEDAEPTLFEDYEEDLNGSYQSIVHLQMEQDGVHIFQGLLDGYQKKSMFIEPKLDFSDKSDDDVKKFLPYYKTRENLFGQIKESYPLKPNPVILKKITTSAEFCSSPDIVLIAVNRIVDTKTGPVVNRRKLILSSTEGSGVIDDFTIKIRRYLDSHVTLIRYKIIAIVCQRGGESIDGGHYICYFINNEQWYYYNDSSPQFKKVPPTGVQRFVDDVEHNCYFFVTEKVVKYI